MTHMKLNVFALCGNMQCQHFILLTGLRMHRLYNSKLFSVCVLLFGWCVLKKVNFIVMLAHRGKLGDE